MDDCKKRRRFTWPWRVAIVAAVVMSGFGLAFSLQGPGVTPEAERYGWAGPEAVAEAAGIVKGMPEFMIAGADGDNETSDVRLWKFSKAVNGGEHFPNVPQQVGDCVSWGAANAVNYLQAVQLARGPPAEFHPAYPPYIYGVSRVLVGNGRLGNSDGSVGAWAAEGLRKYGVLRSDFEGVPGYSGSVARKWGRRPGPPDEFVREGQRFPVETVAAVHSADDVRDSVCNGYPVTIASNWGGRHDRGLSNKHGRIVFKRSGSWNHQMCIVGYDGSGSEPLFYVLNSWGPSIHPAPIDGEPPGGFWIRAGDVDYITRQGDSFAFSGFRGFPARELDFHIVGADR
ncbi:hypothetical protein CA54_16730 [Symmachiella macrocystis]|uniref:Papain family cysteine protease n=1 Tax=Symmachiella macrocystis TaxID=2527985 RepID=A0A5C6BMB6_9PLAN|nr:hypothetical protein [Symmachiella macrocystis]TWU12847.1 hypothetical protein CA54_16730 [Symmachiella macrocystis]